MVDEKVPSKYCLIVIEVQLGEGRQSCYILNLADHVPPQAQRLHPRQDLQVLHDGDAAMVLLTVHGSLSKPFRTLMEV